MTGSARDPRGQHLASQLMHEIDPTYMGMSGTADLVPCGSIKRWRKAQRGS